MNTLYIFVLILSILDLSFSFQLNSSWSNIRSLNFNDNLDKACKGIINDYDDLKGFGSLAQYISSLNLRNSAGKEFLLNLIINESIDGIGDFVSEIIIYIVMIALAVIVLITWPLMWICCCCNCCCFKNERKKGACGLVNFIIALICILMIAITSIIGLAQTGFFINGFNGALCSLLKFFSTAVTGENSDAIPRWGGAKGISDTFTTSINLIKDLNSKSISLPSSSTKIADTKYENDIIDIKNTSLDINDPSDDTKTISPVYKRQLTDTINSNSFISKINKEKEEIIDQSMIVLEELETLLSKIKTDSGIITGLQSVQTLLASFQNLVESISDKIANNIVDVQNIFTQVILYIFFAIYGLFLLISISSLSLLLVYTLCRCYCLKYGIHIMWNVIFLLTILSFIIGCVFGVIGIVGFQFIPVINYIFSSEFLNSPDSPFGHHGSSYLLETCINGDGDLAAAMNLHPKRSSTSLLNDLFLLSSKIEKHKASLSSVSDSIDLPLIESNMNGYLNNIDSTSPKYKTVLDQLNNDYQTCGSIEIITFWVSGQSIGNVEITENHPSESYTCIANFTPTIDERIGFIKQSINSNKDNINAVITQLCAMKIDFNDLLKKIQADLTIGHTNTNSIYDTFSDIIGDHSLYSMFNCRFMRYELISFIDQLSHNFAKSSEGIGICCLICSFSSYIGVFFITNSIYYYSETTRKADIDLNKTNEKKVFVNNENSETRRDHSEDQTTVYQNIKVV